MYNRWTSVGIALLLFAFLPTSAGVGLPPVAVAPNPSQTWQMVGQIGGPTSAVALQGDYAYVGVGLRLVVLDVSDPAALVEVGSTTPFPYFVEDIVTNGTMAYVADGGGGLRVVDISNPTAPTVLGSWDSPGYAEGVAVAGNTVYLADGPYGLRVIDVSIPTHPTPIGSAYDMNYAFEVAVSGDYTYIAAAGAGLMVADVSDPAHLVEVGALDTPGYAYGVAVSGTLAYVADAWEGLRVVDISNPANPVERGACDTPGWALNVAVAGSTAYIADGAFGLRTVDVSDPAHPHEAGAYEVDGLARRVAIAGSTAYVADLRTGLRAVDVSDPALPAQASLYNPMTEALHVAVAGDYAYVAAGFLGLRVIDISDPTHPREVAAYDTEGGYASDIVVSGSYVYLATFMYGPYNLHILDVSDPAHPTRVSTIPMTNYQEYKDLTLVDDILYVTYGWGLQLIDVSDPAAPAKLGFIEEPLQDTQDVAASGTFAYVADASGGVKIIDVSNPHTPTLVSSILPQPRSLGVAATGDKLYVAEHGTGLRVFDVSNPNLPVEIGSYDTPGIAYNVTVSGTLAYIGDGGGGMVVVDVSNPVTPTLAAAYDTAGLAWDTTLEGNYAYIPDGYGGLAILEKSVSGTASQFVLPSDNPSGMDGVDPATGVFPFTKASGLAGTLITSAKNPNSNISEFSTSASLASITYTVTSDLDSGPGTLRQALLDAESGATITFDPSVFPPTSPVTITLVSALPQITQGHLTIDASNAGVILDGSATPPGTSGLVIVSDSNTIQGLQILHFPGDGGVQMGGHYNRIGGDRTKGNGPLGEGNLLSGNRNGGVVIGGVNNTVVGNLIGIDLSGTAAFGNSYGIHLCCGAINNVIGGKTAGDRNIISGNATGVDIIQKGVNGNMIIGNYIGTDITGTHALGNSMVGIVIWDGPSGNIVGGKGPGEGNLISGNQTGMIISGADVNNNSVIGNFIGTDAAGTTALGNSLGISLCGAGFNRVEGNLISGNPSGGITVCDWGWPHNLILGNYIGTDITGTKPLGNGLGIALSGWHVIIGGTSAAERNVIDGSQGAGIDVTSAGTEYNWIAGNVIGSDASGTIPLGNSWGGVLLRDHSTHNFVMGNTIAYNGGAGPYPAGVYVSQLLHNTIRRNAIYGNVSAGILLDEDSNSLFQAPIITTVTETSVSGTSCPGCIVEVFSDAEDEGRFYEGTTVADASGYWMLNTDHSLSGPHATATATDQNGNTSEFSLFQIVWKWLYLPIIRR